MRFKIFIVLLLVLSAPALQKAPAGALYVRPSGNDAGGGTSPADAFQTIARAAQVALPGDTVEISTGSYSEPIRFANSGTAVQPIVFRSAPGERCTVSVSVDTALVLAGARHIRFRNVTFYRNLRPVVVTGASSIRFEECRFDQTGATVAVYNLVQIFGSTDIQFVGCSFDGGWSPTSDGIRVNYGGPQGYTLRLLVQDCYFENFNHYAVNTIGLNYKTMLIGNRATENHGSLSFNQGTGRGMVAFNTMDQYVPDATLSSRGGLGQYFSDSALVRFNIAAQMQNRGGVISSGSAFSAASLYDDSTQIRRLRSHNNTVWLSMPSGLRWHHAYGIENSRASSEMIEPKSLNNIVVGGLVGVWINRSAGYVAAGDFSDFNDGNMLWGPGTPIRYDFQGTANFTMDQAKLVLPTQWGPRNQWAYPTDIDTLDDFYPGPGSNVVDAGRHLAAVTGVDPSPSPTWIRVDDPLFFFDGWETVPGDSVWIAGQSALLVRQGGDTLYFAGPLAAAAPGDSVSVLSAWDGMSYRRVLNGSRPDIGAREYSGFPIVGSSGTIGFSSVVHRVRDNTLGLTDSVRLDYTGTGMKGIQLTLVNAGLTIIRSVSRGRSMPASQWDFFSRISRSVLFNADGSTSDTVRVVFLAKSGVSLLPGSYDNLFTIGYSTINIEEPDSQTTAFQMIEALGSLALGQNAGISPGLPRSLTVVNITQSGDVNNDDRVDILDLVRVISHILERRLLTGDEFLRADVAPWPAGDGTVDVRDLALMQTIILTNRYPDGTPIGKVAAGEAPPAAGDGERVLKGDGPAVVASCRFGSDGMTVHLLTHLRIAGIQIGLSGFPSAAQPDVTPGAFATVAGAVSDNVLRIVAYDPAGTSLAPGDHAIGSIGLGGIDSRTVRGLEVIVVGEGGERVPDVALEIVVDGSGPMPVEYRLSQNYPNPFNPETRLSLSLPEPASIELVVYNTVGQQVRTLVRAEYPAGVHTFSWDGRDEAGRSVAAGVYLYRAVAHPAGGRASAFVETKKMVLIR